MQFEKMKVKELKAIIAKYKKEHVLSNYSKLKKKQLVEILNSKFDLKDGKIYLKSVVCRHPPKKIKEKNSAAIIDTIYRSITNDAR